MPKATDLLREAIINRLVAELRDQRLRLGISLNEVATRSGLSHTMIMRVEKRERLPTIDSLLRISAALQIDLWKILKDATEKAIS